MACLFFGSKIRTRIVPPTHRFKPFSTACGGSNWIGTKVPFGRPNGWTSIEVHAMRLFEQGHAYWCVCTPEELEARRKEAEAKGGSPRYDGRCRNLGLAKPTGDAALWFKAPQAGETIVDDLIKGRVVFDNQILDDVIILRSNGFPHV